jgi:hypothetical protein
MGGVLLAGAGVWLLCQILGGDALHRMNILTSDSGGKPGIGEGIGAAGGSAASDIANALAGRVGQKQVPK